jgi:hypothetical protein
VLAGHKVFGPQGVKHHDLRGSEASCDGRTSSYDEAMGTLIERGLVCVLALSVVAKASMKIAKSTATPM